MKPIQTPHNNIHVAEDQDQYGTLPGTRLEDGTLITCWELSEEDLEQIKATRRIYLHQLTFNQAVQPIRVTAENTLEIYYPYKQKFTDTSLSVCIACLLGKEATKDLWHIQDGFFLNPDNIDALGEWSSQMGKALQNIGTDLEKQKPGEVYIAAGEDPRKPGFIHFCLWQDRAIVHDPHPSNEGLKSIKMIYQLEDF